MLNEETTPIPAMIFIIGICFVGIFSLRDFLGDIRGSTAVIDFSLIVVINFAVLNLPFFTIRRTTQVNDNKR